MIVQWSVIALLVLGLGSCRTTPQKSAASESADAPTPTSSLPMCYGYRGNGSSVFATMGGVARLFDQYGEPSAVVGTSSGSVAAFLTESVMVPGSIYECEGCSKQQVNERRSFVIKAFPLFVNALAQTDGLAKDLASLKPARDVYNLWMKINPLFTHNGDGEGSPNGKKDPEEKSIASKLLNVPFVQKTISKVVLGVLTRQSAEVKDMISPGFYEIAGYGGKSDDELMLKAINNILNFQGIVNESSFQRQRLMYPGVVNFEYVFSMMGTLADWYAGYGAQYPREAMKALLDSCAKDSRGVWWNEVAQRAYANSSCGKEYYALFSRYYKERRKSAEGKRRLDEMMGIYLPSFVSTSAIGGNDVVAAMNKAADQQKWADIDQLQLGREHFRTLYFGAQAFKDKIKAQRTLYNDVLSNSIVSMGSVSWDKGMRASAQEPATARSVMYSEDGQNYLATGGFVDQLQTKLMKMIDCDKTVVINTNSPIFGFANKYAPGIWDQDKTLVNDLFEPKDPKSAESIGFEQTSALLCARWESFKLTEVWEMADSSYHNVMLTKDSSLMPEQQKFRLKDGSESTQNSSPKECYAMPKARMDQFPRYKL